MVLRDLAGMNLLKDEASAITALEYLPTELFPPLFMEAFYGNHRETLKAMVQAWPFGRLPLGGLMQFPHARALQAVLDGLDVLLAQRVHPRCLMSPLENLAITNCLLTESDVTHLSQCPSISQLKGLDLSGITLTHFSPYILQVLLEKVASTLQELYLEKCGIVDPQLEAILPALSHCSALTSFSVRGNLLSMAIVQKVLGCTTRLPGLCQELYPPPRESYSSLGTLLPGRLAQVRAELLESLRALGRPRIIWISYSPCPHCGNDLCLICTCILYMKV
uniref:Melanoma antigen preferentially expressed in tumors-like n=1 Tax=Sus scrofa TaxID=9823 RepID=A0A8D1AIA9_PIG